MARHPIYPLRLDPDVRARWAEAAKAAGCSLPEFIRAAVEARINGGEHVHVRPPSKTKPAEMPAPPAVPPKPTVRVAPSALGTKRSYEPDPKDKPRRRS